MKHLLLNLAFMTLPLLMLNAQTGFAPSPDSAHSFCFRNGEMIPCSADRD